MLKNVFLNLYIALKIYLTTYTDIKFTYRKPIVQGKVLFLNIGESKISLEQPNT